MDSYVQNWLHENELSALVSIFKFDKNKQLFKVLLELIMGKIILYDYIKTGRVNFKHDLCAIVIDNKFKELLQHSDTEPSLSLTAFDLNCLKSEIQDLFPADKSLENLYKQSFNIRDPINGKIIQRVNSSGILYDQYISRKHTFAAIKIVNLSVVNKGRKSGNITELTTVDLSILYNDIILSEEETLDVWRDSFQQRHKISYQNKNFDDIVNEFGVLRSKIGSECVRIDFELMFANAHSDSATSECGSVTVSEKLTCPEPYFVSEALYCLPDELENKREVTLRVITIGKFITEPNETDDFVAIGQMLRQCLPEKDMPYILDIDLDFFSTKNPFRNLYERADLYEKLAKIYEFKRPATTDPEILKEISIARNEQLTELEGFFTILQQERNFNALDDVPKTPRYHAVLQIYEDMHKHYNDREIDWKLIHDMGCTIDDTELPHHVTNKNDLDRLIEGSFKSFLDALPASPTIVTISRSSEDEYCPAEDVEQIQCCVLDELQVRIGSEVDIRLSYLEEDNA